MKNLKTKQYQAKIDLGIDIRQTVKNADASRKRIAVCFSGGGSRALTCAWGQLIGLNSLKDRNGQKLLDQVRYISSVSGGSWAAVLYTFRPDKYTDEQFLGAAYKPSQLYYSEDMANCLNVSKMGENALGNVPQKFANVFSPVKTRNIIVEFFAITLLRKIPIDESVKWLWMYIVGRDVLADFDLYKFSKSSLIGVPWQYKGADFFSLSKTYATENIFAQHEAPPTDGFVYARTGQGGKPTVPMLIINTNVIGKNAPNKVMSGPMQIPCQISPVAAGIFGSNPSVADGIGGGCVDSFAFTARLVAATGAQVSCDFERRYSLADITACSSAFFAATLADPMTAAISWLADLDDEEMANYFATFGELAARTNETDLEGIRAKLGEYAKKLRPSDFLPQYNYWPIDEVSLVAQANRNTIFTDGGSMDNTGVAGLLAQLQGDANRIIAFVNGAQALEEKNGQIIAATQMAPLFGVAYDAHSGQFENYQPDGVNPFTKHTDPIGFLQVFDNTQGEFDALRVGLYAANGAGAKTGPAFFQQKLVLVSNQLLGIKGGDLVNLLWVQNAEVSQWQRQITDPVLLQKIKVGQEQGGLSEFANFPYYSTFLKLYQTEAETNTLAQMHSWCVSDDASPLCKVIVEFFALDD